MSIILDALKKLDREKSSRRNRTANIAAEILRPAPARPENRILRYLAAAGLAAVVTASATYGVIHFGFLPKSTTSGPPSLSAHGQQVAPAPVSRESTGDAKIEANRPPAEIASAEGKTPAPLPPDPGPVGIKPPVTKVAPPQDLREPVGGTRNEIAQVPSKTQSPDEKKNLAVLTPLPPSGPVEPRPKDQPPVPAPGLRDPAGNIQGEKGPAPAKVQSPDENRSLRPSNQRAMDAKPSGQQAPLLPVSREPASGQTPKGQSANPPSMKLSGIVWSSEPSERLAVINSQVVKEGTIVEGAKVVEIGPTSVRLMHNGSPFEISINVFNK